MTPTCSKQDDLGIYLFPCGDGDTVLIRLPDDRWILVDCCLSKADGTLDRFLAFLEEQGIQRFAMVMLTHPDEDHFRGMGDLLLRFASNTEEYGPTVFVDSGFNRKELRSYYSVHAGKSSYRKLLDALESLERDGKLDPRSADSQIRPMEPRGLRHRIKFIPVGPDPSKMRKRLRDQVVSLSQGRDRGIRANNESIVLVLRIVSDARSSNILLAGDAEHSGLNDSIDRWREWAELNSAQIGFRVLKVPHHGTRASFNQLLVDCREPTPAECVAAISAGGSTPGFPDRSVIEKYIEAGWTVLLTTPRTAPSTPSSLLDLMPRLRSTLELRGEIVEICLDSQGHLEWKPKECIVSREDLHAY